MDNKSKWVVFDKKGKRVKTVTLTHKDNRHYIELEPFEREMESKGQYAHRLDSLTQDHLKGKPLIEKLKILGWQFDQNGVISN
jgi:hypothetical protein